MRVRVSWGTGMALVYGIFASSTVAVVVFAMSRPVDLVSPDYYQRSLEQDRRMAAVANARALGAAFELVVDEGARAIVIRLPPEHERTAAGIVTLYRPSDAAADRRVPFEPLAGRQRVNVADLAAGRWMVQIEWTAEGRPFYAEMPVNLP